LNTIGGTTIFWDRIDLKTEWNKRKNKKKW